MPSFAIPAGGARKKALKRIAVRHGAAQAEAVEAEWRKLEAAVCSICGNPIGTRTYVFHPDQIDPLHALCVEEANTI